MNRKKENYHLLASWVATTKRQKFTCNDHDPVGLIPSYDSADANRHVCYTIIDRNFVTLSMLGVSLYLVMTILLLWICAEYLKISIYADKNPFFNT